MACNMCSFIIGGNYLMTGNCPCFLCGTEVPTDNVIGTYQGISNTLQHKFRIHPYTYCPGCGEKMDMISIQCEDSGYEQELAKLFNINQYISNE